MTDSVRRLLLRRVVVIIVLVGPVLSMWLGYILYQHGSQVTEGGYSAAVKDRVGLIHNNIEESINHLRHLSRLFHVTNEVDQETFHEYLLGETEQHNALKSMLWVDRVAHKDRLAYERRQGRGHPGFAILDHRSGEAPVPSDKRSEYFPIRLADPHAPPWLDRIGIDITTLCIPSSQIENLRRGRSYIVCTRRAAIDGEKRVVRVFYPLFDESGDGELLGLAVGIFDLEHLVENALSKVSTGGVDLLLKDSGQPDSEQLLYVHMSRARGHDLPVTEIEWDHSQELHLGDQKWLVLAAPAPGYHEVNLWSPVMVACTGVLLSLMLAGYLSQIQRHHRENIESLEKQGVALRLAERYFNDAGSISVVLDEKGRIKDINSAACDLIGVDRDELLDVCWFESFVPLDVRKEQWLYFQLTLDVRADNSLKTVVGDIQCEMGERRAIAWRYALLEPMEGETKRIFCSGVDISRQREMEKSLQASHESFTNVVDKNRSGILVLNMEGRIQFANPAACQLIGRSENELVGEEFGIPSLGSHSEKSILRPGIGMGVAEMTATETQWHGERAYLVMLHDITERKLAEERIQHMAYHDALTGLPNRNLFTDRLRHALLGSKRKGSMIGVIFMDVDRFKSINDTLGHDVGDELLQEVTRRLVETTRESDTLARMGGDEFTILLEDLHSSEQAGQVANKILSAFESPVQLAGQNLYISMSMGISLCPQDADSASALLRHADSAMYQAKRNHTGYIRFYSADLEGIESEQLQLENALRETIKQELLELHYQPQVDLDTGQLAGLEVLLRWHWKERGWISPEVFIPVLEETGLINEVGSWVIDTACAQMAEWQAQGLDLVPVSVNLSPRQLVSNKLYTDVESALNRYGLQPDHLGLEITETAVMTDSAGALAMLNRLTQLGVKLHMDDFGTGYSSLGLLRRLPFDTVKVDKSFIADVMVDVEDAVLTETIIAMAHSLGKDVIAEGVETEEQRDFLRQLHCNLAQGWLFGRPVPAIEITRLLSVGVQDTG